MMQHIGIKLSYQERDLKSRAAYPKYNTRAAGYLSDLSRDIPTSIGVKPDFANIQRKIEEVYNSFIGQVRKAEQEVLAEKQKVQKQHQIALLRAKYTPDNAMSSEWDILEAMFKQDKYLALAYFLEKNRGDWSDGYNYAEQGLGWFTVETPEDKEIADEIQAIIDDDDGCDGRNFRDCEHNYDVLYSMVKDEQLLKDLDLIKSSSEHI
jgi:hypothetical protein